ncbi:unnamed protein product [Brassicogethes aeneus]|uniref:C2H2-type domain-containing protein n=1 Tax=Brassicogethes aeneus TaxID=1431903 RepID=A0A9P0B911_BRAAE|nr:unnamed protein product [Brassicogethes aeneus]
MDNSPKDTKKNAITYYCVHCKFSTSSFNKFHAHNLSCENLTFKCSFCELICFSQNNFDIHVYRRHKRQNDVEKRYFFKNELFSCEKCDHVGVKSDTRHECDPKKVQIKQQKKHHCGYCNFSCKKAFNLSRHCETLHKVKNYSAEMVELINQSKSNHQCPYCESFRSETTLNLQNHVLNEHWEQNDVEKKIKFNFLKCQNCLFRTLQKKLLVEHILRCHKETSKLLQSPVAPKPDTKLKEPKRRQYRCTQCPYKTRSLLNVVKHQKGCKEVDAQPVPKDLDGLFKVKRVKP